jgi:hypothetical protein
MHNGHWMAWIGVRFAPFLPHICPNSLCFLRGTLRFLIYTSGLGGFAGPGTFQESDLVRTKRDSRRLQTIDHSASKREPYGNVGKRPLGRFRPNLYG